MFRLFRKNSDKSRQVKSGPKNKSSAPTTDIDTTLDGGRHRELEMAEKKPQKPRRRTLRSVLDSSKLISFKNGWKYIQHKGLNRIHRRLEQRFWLPLLNQKVSSHEESAIPSHTSNMDQKYNEELDFRNQPVVKFPDKCLKPQDISSYLGFQDILSVTEQSDLYSVVFRMCTQRQPNNFTVELYLASKKLLQTYVTDVIGKTLSSTPDINLLDVFVRRVQIFELYRDMIRRILLYLDEYFVKHHGLDDIRSIADAYFEDLVLSQFANRLTKLFLAQVKQIRQFLDERPDGPPVSTQAEDSLPHIQLSVLATVAEQFVRGKKMSMNSQETSSSPAHKGGLAPVQAKRRFGRSQSAMTFAELKAFEPSMLSNAVESAYKGFADGIMASCTLYYDRKSAAFIRLPLTQFLVQLRRLSCQEDWLFGTVIVLDTSLAKTRKQAFIQKVVSRNLNAFFSTEQRRNEWNSLLFTIALEFERQTPSVRLPVGDILLKQKQQAARSSRACSWVALERSLAQHGSASNVSIQIIKELASNDTNLCRNLAQALSVVLLTELEAVYQKRKTQISRMGAVLLPSNAPFFEQPNGVQRFYDSLLYARPRRQMHANPHSVMQLMRDRAGFEVDCVEDFIRVFHKYKRILDTGLGVFEAITKHFDETISSFLNKPAEPPTLLTYAELLAHYTDFCLNSSYYRRSEDQIEVLTSQISSLFRYVSDKDLFTNVYQAHLAKRLLYRRSHSDEAEKSMVQKLKFATAGGAGARNTSRLEAMLSDIAKSKSISRAFQERYKSPSKLLSPAGDMQLGVHAQQADPELFMDLDFLKDIDGTSPFIPMVPLNVSVLTRGFWPGMRSVSVELPALFRNAVERFEHFYVDQSAEHKRRKLHWNHALGYADLTMTLPGQSPAYLRATTLQAVVLYVVNEHITGRLLGDNEEDQETKAGDQKDDVSREPSVSASRDISSLYVNTSQESKRLPLRSPDFDLSTPAADVERRRLVKPPPRLLSLGDKHSLSVKELCKRLGVSTPVLAGVLHSMIFSKFNILQKSPPLQTFRDDDLITVNPGFSQVTQGTLFLPEPRLEPRKKVEVTHKKNYHRIIESVVVRMMKRERVASKSAIVTHVFTELAGCQIKNEDIDARLENLVENEYLELQVKSTETDEQKYSYVP